MGIKQQLKGLLKSEFIQMKRKKFLSSIELFCPIILLLCFLFLRLSFETEKETYDSLFKNDLDFLFKYGTNLTNKVKDFNGNIQSLEEVDKETTLPYYGFLSQCKAIKHIALIGQKFPQKLIDMISLHYWEMDDFDENEIFKKFESVEEFDEYITSKDYGTIEKPKICFGISKTDKFKFGIHYNSINIDNSDSNEFEDLLSQESPHIPDMKSNKNEKIRIQENLKFFEFYKNSGYLMTLKIIYDYILQEITSDPNAEINFVVTGMKFDEILKDDFHRFLSLLGFFVIISYSIPFSINIYKIIHFKETKKKEYLKSMGVKEIIFFMSSFIRCLIINIFHSIFCSLLVKFILKQSQYIYLFFIFLLFGLVIFSMTFFFQSFLKESRIGVIISLLLFCIMSFLYLPIYSPAVNISFTYFICVLFPPANLLLGFNTFYTFEKEFSPLNDRVNLDVSKITISLMITFLFVSFVIYLILGYIVSKCFCPENENEKCCCSKKKSRINYINSINDDISSDISDKDTYAASKDDYNNSNSSSRRKKRINNPPPKNQTGTNMIDEDPKDTNHNNNMNGGKGQKETNQNINNGGDNSFKNIGMQYIDDDISEQESIKLNEEKNMIKSNYYDLIKSYAKNEPKDMIEKKKQNLKDTVKDFMKKTNIKEATDNKKQYLLDECEMDIENQIEYQKMRNKRRLGKSTMYNLKQEENYLNESLNVTAIIDIIDEPDLNNSIKDLIDLIDNSKDYNISNDNSDTSKAIRKKDTIKFETKKKKAKNVNGAKLEIKKINKKYDYDKMILNNLTFTLHENEIYTLLGQNGAGKSTFISILSGLVEANSGSIIYEEDNKIIDTNNPEFRKILGICHQNNNILYDELTVEENLEIFCLLKYDKKKNGPNESYKIEQEVKDLIESFELNEERKKLAKELSGGQKRKLAIAIAFSGRSKIIVLDEPTGGIDIIARKALWNIIKKKENKDGKIILLITHFMDEASFLSDTIGIIKDGRIVCSGTSRELIDNYGKYITIEINKKADEKVKQVVKYINNNIILKENDNSYSNSFNNNESGKNNLIDPSNTSLSVKNNNTFKKEKTERKVYKEKIVIKIPTRLFNISKINELIKKFEENDINDYRIIKDQLEDAFINVIKKENKNDKKDYITLLDMDKFIKKYTYYEKLKNQLKLLFFKRGYETLRDKKSFILEILFPIILVLIACLVSYIEILEDNKSSIIELNTFSNETQTIFYSCSNVTDILPFQGLISEIQKEKKKLENYNFTYLPNYGVKEEYNIIENLISYMNIVYEYTKNEKITNNSANFYLIYADKTSHKYEFASLISTKQRHSPIAYTNYLLKNIIRSVIKEKSNSPYSKDIDNIAITNSPFLISYEERNNKKARNGFVLVFFISIALALIPSNFITIILREKEKKSKNLQLLSGLSIYAYWINNYIYEFTKYFVVVGICFIIIASFTFYEKYFIIFYILYGPAIVSFTYFMSYFLNTQGAGQTITLLINLIFGALGGSAVLIMRTNQSMKKLGIFLSYLFRFIPSFCISYGYNQLISKKILFAIDYYNKNITDKEEIETIKNKYNDSSNIIKDSSYITNDIVFLVFEIFIYAGLLFFLEKKDYFLLKFGCTKKELISYNLDNGKIYTENPGYTTGRKPIKNGNKDESYPLQVINLSKSYYENKNFFNCCKKNVKTVLKNLSFENKNGECFGLLGKNGEGKSTAFKCLCQEIKPDKGSVIIDDINIFNYANKKKPIIGYCPQFDSIFEYLTVEENLKFYGKLKGITNEYSLNDIIKCLMKQLDLEEYRYKLSGHLSGGNKRKLSVGISILSKPTVILMDEPSTGMDPYTRRLLLDLLHKAYLKNNFKGKEKEKINNEEKGRSIVLVTHSIEEAETLCDRVGILYEGKLEKDGKISNLINNSNIELDIEFKKPSSEYLKEKYGKKILSEKIIGEEQLKKFLLSDILSQAQRKRKYSQYIKQNSFGKELLKVIKNKKCIGKYTVLRWVEFMDNVMGLIEKIKEYFNYVHCINFKLNSFFFIIKNIGNNKEKNDNHIFGIIEKYKEEYQIEEYTYLLTTLESVFINCYPKDNKEEDKNEIKNTDISL